ncbi:formate acetyltransferase [Actinoplanes sp. NBRC 14428]|uniref:Formate acetyltransferase n=1 Tax=Pseudosporangium ferrugineum TaxID=439699 RepID=A0A2T0SG87_9ACTN|nr:formate C-acetyltransferase [Pseudosporangium ferrugineum]PRY32373.1 formate C-acetyltransferase [Pseudosporangium ferrugineum]BCJ49378.1 formate acetyltransferase [Actinoplanes sp. NBRC 14428]
MEARNAWRGFTGDGWRDTIDVSAFIHDNVTPYDGDAEFLAGPTHRTERLWRELQRMFVEERSRGVYDIDTHTPSTITSHAPGFIDRSHELIVGLQTSAPLRRAIMPAGGLRMVEAGLKAYGYALDPTVHAIFSRYRKSHNAGVFDAYPEDVLAARRSHIITGLPDAYGRGRIIGDYRRVALYGVDRLIAERKELKRALDGKLSAEDVIRDREELAEQIRALGELKEMAAGYGYDLSGPATTGREAIQWLYFAYLGATKEQNGAAMSLGRTSSFIDVYLERDLAEGTLTEEAAQELIDDFVIKLRIIRFLRTPEYDELFSGDPTWVTEAIGGKGLVTRTSFRYLQTLYDLGPAPEPNLTVLWSPDLPEGFKRFCAQVSIDTSSIQYENDDLLCAAYDDDTAIACCVSAMRVGKDMQFFGARANLAKALLYAINGGRDELTGAQVTPPMPAIETDVLDYEQVMAAFDRTLDWLAETYVDALNVIHYMHDKYAYERLEMALHDHPVHRFLATGIAGLSVAADSLSAIKYAQVKVLRDTDGKAVDYTVDGDFPTYGNNDDRADAIAVDLVERFMAKIRRQPTYRDSEPSLSVLTITSNVVYGKHTGNTPDGRRAGEPFAPGANPMNGRDRHGLVAAALSVAKLPYASARDGISLTTTVTPAGLGRSREERIGNLAGVLDGYTAAGGFHLNVNVLDRATLEDAMAHPEKYPQLTIRVSGYAVNFVRLTTEQQRDVISRTFHGALW